MVSRFYGLPLSFGGDIKVTLEMEDKPRGVCGWDPGQEAFRAFILGDTLKEMGCVNCGYNGGVHQVLHCYCV